MRTLRNILTESVNNDHVGYAKSVGDTDCCRSFGINP